MKTFEQYTNKPKLYDYVMVDPYCVIIEELQEYFKTAIGKLIEIYENDRLCYVHFENIPDNVGEFLCTKEPFRINNIIVWGKTKKEILIKKESEKFNL